MTTNPIEEVKTWADLEVKIRDFTKEYPELEEAFEPLMELALIMQDAPGDDASPTEVKAWQREVRECADLIAKSGEALLIAIKIEIPAATIPDAAYEGLPYFRDLARAWPEDFDQKKPADILQDLLKAALHPSRLTDL